MTPIPDSNQTDQPKSIALSETAREIRPFLAPQWPWIAGVVVISIASAGAEALGVGVMLPFIETLVGHQDGPFSSLTPLAPLTNALKDLPIESKIRVFALSIFAIMALRQGFAYLNTRFTQLVRAKIVATLRQELFNRYLHMDMSLLYKERQSELITMLEGFTVGAGNVLYSCISIIPHLLLLTAYIAILAVMSWPMTLASVVGMVIAFILVTGIARRRGYWGMVQKVVSANVKKVSMESLAAMHLLRLLVREEYTKDKFNKEMDSMVEIASKSSHYEALSSATYQIAGWSMMVVVLFLATSAFTFDGETWVELILLYIFLLSRLIGPASALNNHRMQIAGNLPATERLIDFIHYTGKSTLPDGSLGVDKITGDIVLEGVKFKYSTEDRMALNGLDMTIANSKVTAIVGPSGAGKSTLLELLTRMHDPTEGRVLMGGVDLREFRLAQWRRKIAVVSQQVFLFNDTARENIRYGRLEASDEEIIDAAKMANAHEFLSELPKGYDTQLGDQGVRLSGGQAQRIAIARAFLVNPSLLILDEATSAQDSESEQLVQKAAYELMKGRTSVVVAHRLSTVRHADKIFVLENGRVVESGGHEELISRGGRYRQLVKLQELRSDPA